MELVVRPLSGPPADLGPVEVVERKGLGHPDSICDARRYARSSACS
jgi:S-adenosylmethionine synthetase